MSNFNYKRINDDGTGADDYLKDFKPLEVKVTHSFEDGFRKFKALVQKDKVLALYKEKQRYEKPSDKARRKHRESIEKVAQEKRKDDLMKSGEWDRIVAKKQQKKQAKENAKRSESTSVKGRD